MTAFASCVVLDIPRPTVKFFPPVMVLPRLLLPVPVLPIIKMHGSAEWNVVSNGFIELTVVSACLLSFASIGLAESPVAFIESVEGSVAISVGLAKMSVASIISKEEKRVKSVELSVVSVGAWKLSTLSVGKVELSVVPVGTVELSVVSFGPVELLALSVDTVFLPVTSGGLTSSMSSFLSSAHHHAPWSGQWGHLSHLLQVECTVFSISRLFHV